MLRHAVAPDADLDVKLCPADILTILQDRQFCGCDGAALCPGPALPRQSGQLSKAQIGCALGKDLKILPQHLPFLDAEPHESALNFKEKLGNPCREPIRHQVLIHALHLSQSTITSSGIALILNIDRQA